MTHAANTHRRRRAVTATRPVAPPHTLALHAVRGASWLAVRSRTAGGRILYQGILAQGRSVRLRGERFWVRAGAAANLSAAYDGRPVRSFPTGTVTMTIVDGVAHVLG